MLALTVLSSAFVAGAAIPPRFTCMGEDVSPHISWSKVPQETESVALICDDPDAPSGDWVHWVVFNIPPDVEKLDANVPENPTLPNGTIQGVNDFGKNGYGGPCPPPGKPHRYFFRVYALDTKLELPPSITKAQLLKAMEGHVLAKGDMAGMFGR